MAGTLIFLLSSSFSPSPSPPSCGRNSTWSQRQSDGVVTVTTSPFRVNTLNKAGEGYCKTYIQKQQCVCALTTLQTSYLLSNDCGSNTNSASPSFSDRSFSVRCMSSGGNTLQPLAPPPSPAPCSSLSRFPPLCS